MVDDVALQLETNRVARGQRRTACVTAPDTTLMIVAPNVTGGPGETAGPTWLPAAAAGGNAADPGLSSPTRPAAENARK